MSQVDVVRAWTDEEYLESLSPAQRSAVPPHPAGLVELDAADMMGIAGGTGESYDYCPTQDCSIYCSTYADCQYASAWSFWRCTYFCATYFYSSCCA